MVARLRMAFASAATRHWFAPFADLLLLDGFADVSAASFAPLLEWDRAARAAGFNWPA
jgi:hypothetical protein